MNSLINGAPSATPFGTPFISSFASPFSSPFNSAGIGQIGTPMFSTFSNSFGPFSTPFASPFGSPITNQFGTPGSAYFGSPVGGFGQPTLGQPIWNQGLSTPFAGQFGFGGGQFGSPVTPFATAFGSYGTPFGFPGFSPIAGTFGGQFSTPLASGFGSLPFGLPSSLPIGDWSTLGGRFGTFSTPFGSMFGTPFAGQSLQQFGISPWSFGGGSNTGWTNGLSTGITGGIGGFSPINSIYGSPFGGIYGQPVSGFSPWTSPVGMTGFGGIPTGTFASPISGLPTGVTSGAVNGYGTTGIPGTPSYNGQGVGGYSPVSGSPISPITGNTTYSNTGVTLNQGQPGFVHTGVTGYNTLPTHLVSGQFVNQGWNTPVVGQAFGSTYGQPFNTTGHVINGFPIGYQGQGFTSHGNPSELRSAAGTTINVSQREAA